MSHKQHQSSDRIGCKTGAIVTLDRPPIDRLAVERSYSKFWVPIGECVRNRILAHPARSGRITPSQRVGRESPGRRLVFPNCRRHGEPGPRPLLAAARPSAFQCLATRKRVSSTRALSWRCSFNSVTAPMTPEKTTEVGREVHGKNIKPRPPLLAQGSPPRIRFCHPSLTPSPCSTQRRQTACQTGPHIWLQNLNQPGQRNRSSRPVRQSFFQIEPLSLHERTASAARHFADIRWSPSYARSNCGDQLGPLLTNIDCSAQSSFSSFRAKPGFDRLLSCLSPSSIPSLAGTAAQSRG